MSIHTDGSIAQIHSNSIWTLCRWYSSISLLI